MEARHHHAPPDPDDEDILVTGCKHCKLPSSVDRFCSIDLLTPEQAKEKGSSWTVDQIDILVSTHEQVQKETGKKTRLLFDPRINAALGIGPSEDTGEEVITVPLHTGMSPVRQPDAIILTIKWCFKHEQRHLQQRALLNSMFQTLSERVGTPEFFAQMAVGRGDPHDRISIPPLAGLIKRKVLRGIVPTEEEKKLVMAGYDLHCDSLNLRKASPELLAQAMMNSAFQFYELNFHLQNDLTDTLRVSQAVVDHLPIFARFEAVFRGVMRIAEHLEPRKREEVDREFRSLLGNMRFQYFKHLSTVPDPCGEILKNYYDRLYVLICDEDQKRYVDVVNQFSYFLTLSLKIPNFPLTDHEMRRTEQLLNDDDVAIRISTAQSLRRRREPEIPRMLEERLFTEERKSVRWALLEALHTVLPRHRFKERTLIANNLVNLFSIPDSAHYYETPPIREKTTMHSRCSFIACLYGEPSVVLGHVLELLNQPILSHHVCHEALTYLKELVKRTSGPADVEKHIDLVYPLINHPSPFVRLGCLELVRDFLDRHSDSPVSQHALESLFYHAVQLDKPTRLSIIRTDFYRRVNDRDKPLPANFEGVGLEEIVSAISSQQRKLHYVVTGEKTAPFYDEARLHGAVDDLYQRFGSYVAPSFAEWIWEGYPLGSLGRYGLSLMQPSEKEPFLSLLTPAGRRALHYQNSER